MSIANLGVKIKGDSSKIFTLENGSLRYIDDITSSFVDKNQLMNSERYKEKIQSYLPSENFNNMDLILTYTRNNDDKKELKMILNDSEAIRTRTSSLEDVKSETERARKLLLNSKEQLFLTFFLLNQNLEETTRPTVKMTIDEYKNAKKSGYDVIVHDGEYRISIKDVLRYRLNNKKMGSMRLLIEDTLEVWKKNVFNSTNDDLYFYSRELHLLINEYESKKIPRRIICNLNFGKKVLDSMVINRRNNYFGISENKGLPKRKFLDERKTA